MKSALDSLIEELEAGTWYAPTVPRPGDGAQRKAEPRTSEAKRTDLTSGAGSLDAEQRFGQPHARLFPFLGRKVRTPGGVGTLIQVFANGCTVVLDSQASECARFAPAEIEPVSWEVP
jgi:hypothetical protein